MIAVAAGDVIAGHLLRHAARGEADHRMVAVEPPQRHVRGLVDRSTASGVARLHQVAGDLSLAVDRDVAAGETADVDAVPVAVELQLDPVVRQTFRVQAGRDSGTFQQRHGALFEHAGADPGQHVIAAVLLDDDRVDAPAVEQATEQQPRRARTDDGDLRAHGVRRDSAGGLRW